MSSDESAHSGFREFDIDYCWTMYQQGQASADHTAKEVFGEVLRGFAETLAERAKIPNDAQEAIAIAKLATEVMGEFHAEAKPDGTPDENPTFPAAAFKKFVDEHARLTFRVARFESNPVEPAYLNLRRTAQVVCNVLGYHGSISSRDDRVIALVDALYGTDDGVPEMAKWPYISKYWRRPTEEDELKVIAGDLVEEAQSFCTDHGLKDPVQVFLAHRTSSQKNLVAFNATFDEWWTFFAPYFHMPGLGRE